MAIDLRNFLFHSDYPMDKVVAIISGGPVTVAAYGSGSATVAHSLPEKPLCILTWSYNSSFNDSRDNMDSVFRYDIPYVNVRSNGTNINVNITNNTDTSKNIYWRVIMLPQPNTVSDYSPPTTSNPFILNTDKNYFKCVLEGFTSTGTSVSHNLGYRPHVLGWYEDVSGWIYPLTSSILFSSSPRIRVENNTIEFTMGSAVRIYYRIYADG